MKYLKTKNVYKARNVFFDANKVKAYSYNWWCFVKIIDGKVIFNTHRYSASTGKHQHKVRSLLGQLGIKVDLFVDTRGSLDNDAWVNHAIAVSIYKIEILKGKIAKGKRYKDAERYFEINKLIAHIDLLKSIGFNLSNQSEVS